MTGYRDDSLNRERREEGERRAREEREEAEELARYVEQKRVRRFEAAKVGADGLYDAEREVQHGQDRVARVIGGVSLAVGLLITAVSVSMLLDGAWNWRARTPGCATLVGPILVLWGLQRLISGRARS